MSAHYEFIVQAADGTFLSIGGQWRGEYPDAKLFPTLQAAKRALDFSKPYKPAGIYQEDDYANGKAPKVQS